MYKIKGFWFAVKYIAKTWRYAKFQQVGKHVPVQGYTVLGDYRLPILEVTVVPNSIFPIIRL